MSGTAFSGTGKSSIPFPFSPYPQQQQLMEAIFETVAASKSGCFESPTGTGKSLSVICSALHWQHLQEESEKEEFVKSMEATAKEKSGSDDWLADMISSNGVHDKAKEKATKQKERSLMNYKDMLTRAAKLSMIDNAKVHTTEALHRLSSSKSGYRASGFGAPVVNKGTKAPVLSSAEGETSSLLSADEEFILPQYDSDDATKKRKSKSKKKMGAESGGFAASHYDLADKIHKQGKYADSDSDNESDEGEIAEENELLLPQIFYCSRTHSQLAQFVEELRKTAFGADVRCVTLGSRKNLCINPSVLKLGSDARINDKCLDMLKSKSADKSQGNGKDGAGLSKKQKVGGGAKPCEFHKHEREERFGDYARGRVRDIEELVVLGKQLEACPYYSTRKAVQTAQVVCMPYTTLLHADTRASMGLRLRGNVVVFDEAHNLIEAVNHANSAEVSRPTLDIAVEAISKYLDRFQTILAGRNLYYVQLLSSVTVKLKAYLGKVEKERVEEAARGAAREQDQMQNKEDAGSGSASGANGATQAQAAAGPKLMSATDFIFSSKLDNVNLFKLRRHILETNLIGRVGGYGEAAARRAAAAASGAMDVETASTRSSTGPAGRSLPPSDTPVISPYTNALRNVLALLTCLTNAEEDGRIVITCEGPEVGVSTGDAAASRTPSRPESSIRFLLLNPSAHFKAIADEARSVVLLGGTLQPFDYLASSLFLNTKTPPRDLKFFSCGHVVDRSNVATLVLGQGLNGSALEFTHKSKFRRELTEDLLVTMSRLAKVTPNGMVVFFTSYSYMDWLVSDWRRKGLLASLTKQKDLFVEPRGVAEAEAVWNGYSRAATRSGAGARGAVLLCVMGGKLSEGINFSDSLARAVVVVGMPFPDGRDPVLQEKLKQAERLEQAAPPSSSSSSSSVGSGSASKKLYEAMCMNSVNQSIGRSIRHAGDYAAILLVDRRYRQERVTSLLPQWIRSTMKEANTLGAAAEILTDFYSRKAAAT